MEGNYTLWDKLKLVPAYQSSYKLAEEIHICCQKIKNNRDFWHIYDQLIRAIDSVSANIAEGYGRFFYKDKVRFYYQSRGSLLEVCDWLAKTRGRGFLEDERIKTLKPKIDQLFKDIEILIYFAKKQITKKDG